MTRTVLHSIWVRLSKQAITAFCAVRPVYVLDAVATSDCPVEFHSRLVALAKKLS